LSYFKNWACFVLYTTPMQLMMYIGNDLIEAVPLNLHDIPKPGYLGSFKRNLKLKYRELIQQFPEPPEFLVIEPASKTQQATVIH
jgi:hypothetical protein